MCKAAEQRTFCMGNCTPGKEKCPVFWVILHQGSKLLQYWGNLKRHYVPLLSMGADGSWVTRKVLAQVQWIHRPSLELLLGFKCVPGTHSHWFSDMGDTCNFCKRSWVSPWNSLPHNSIPSQDSKSKAILHILGGTAEISTTVMDWMMQEWWSLLISPFYVYNDPVEKTDVGLLCTYTGGSPSSSDRAWQTISSFWHLARSCFCECFLPKAPQQGGSRAVYFHLVDRGCHHAPGQC